MMPAPIGVFVGVNATCVCMFVSVCRNMRVCLACFAVRLFHFNEWFGVVGEMENHLLGALWPKHAPSRESEIKAKRKCSRPLRTSVTKLYVKCGVSQYIYIYIEYPICVHTSLGTHFVLAAEEYLRPERNT